MNKTMDRKHSKEIAHEEKVHVYAKNRYLNKIIYGADRRLMEDENINLRMEVQACLDDCYLLVTGMKRWQFDLLPQGQYRYFDRAPAMSEAVYKILDTCGYQGDYTYMDPTQEICVLFSEKPDRKEPLEVEKTAEQIQDCLYKILMENIPEEQLCCYTALAEPVSAYEELPVRFRQASMLHELSWFDMQPMVMTEEKLKQIRIPYSFQDASEALKILERMLEQGEPGEEVLEALFRERIKKSYDFALCEDVLSGLKRIFWEFYQSYGMPGEFPREIFERKSFIKLEDVYDKILLLWRDYHGWIQNSRKCMSYITRNAVLYMRNHFDKGITARDVADFVHVSPSHLSHTFNREMHQSIPAFLVACRIQEGKRLLRETDLRIGEVAEQVGISNVSYFLKIFKQYEGMTPQEFRHQFL